MPILLAFAGAMLLGSALKAMTTPQASQPTSLRDFCGEMGANARETYRCP